MQKSCKIGRGAERTLRLGHVLWHGRGVECFKEERRALPPLFPPAHLPMGFFPNMRQIVGFLPDVGSSHGHQLESFSVTWTALEENWGRDGLSSCSTMWKIAGQLLLTAKAACSSMATPLGILPLKAVWPGFGWAQEHIIASPQPIWGERVVSGSQEEKGSIYSERAKPPCSKSKMTFSKEGVLGYQQDTFYSIIICIVCKILKIHVCNAFWMFDIKP